MHVDWRKPGAYIRLLVAYLAANAGQKIDYQKVATYYGEGATYDAVEGQFRKFRREAKEMIDEIDCGMRPPAPIRGSPVKKRGGNKRSTSTETDLEGDVPATPPPTPKKTRKPRASKKKDASPFPETIFSGRITKSTTPQRAIGGRGNANRRFKHESTPEISPNSSFTSSASFDTHTSESSLESNFTDNFAAALPFDGNLPWNMPLSQQHIYQPSSTISTYWAGNDI